MLFEPGMWLQLIHIQGLPMRVQISEALPTLHSVKYTYLDVSLKRQMAFLQMYIPSACIISPEPPTLPFVDRLQHSYIEALNQDHTRQAVQCIACRPAKMKYWIWTTWKWANECIFAFQCMRSTHSCRLWQSHSVKACNIHNRVVSTISTEFIVSLLGAPLTQWRRLGWLGQRRRSRQLGGQKAAWM